MATVSLPGAIPSPCTVARVKASIKQKPRLNYARQSCGEDLHLISDAYHDWVDFDEYLALHYEVVATGEHFAKLVKCSKRGNDVYSWRVEKKLPKIESSADLVYDDHVRSQFVFATFEYNSWNIDCFGSWVEAPAELNRAMSRLRKKHPGVKMVMRSFEAHSSGYLHAHVLLMFPEKMSMHREWVNRNGGMYIYYIPDDVRADIKESWTQGYDDIMGMPTARGGCRYTMKYMIKTCTANEPGSKADYTLAMNWYLRRRSFHVTKDVQGIIRRDERLHNSNQIQQDLDGNSHPVYILLKNPKERLHPVCLKKDPGRWSLRVSEKEFESMIDHSFDQDERLYGGRFS